MNHWRNALVLSVSLTAFYASGCDSSLLHDVNEVVRCDSNESRLAEDSPSTWYRDDDQDGYGNSSLKGHGCRQPDGYVELPGDCDDSDPDKNLDCEPINTNNNDCGMDQQLVFYRDRDGDSYGDSDTVQTFCIQPPGFVEVGGDCQDDNPDINPEAEEVCDGQDNNCDKQTDEGFELVTYYLDADNDGYGNDGETVEACAAPVGYIEVSGDCQDGNPNINPEAEEVCDEQDNNCNDQTDEGLELTTYFLDADSDGYGNDGRTIEACALPPGYVEVAGDCNDNNRQVHPDQADNCDEIDNDCDDQIDEDEATSVFYLDSDSDGFGDRDHPVVACTAPSGTVANDDDCDDSDEAINGAADEICDEIDNNCNGLVDDGLELITSYLDGDGDGFAADSATPLEKCDVPDGYVTVLGDCADDNADRAPGLVDECDGIDTDCDGFTDEDATFSGYYLDSDGDGFGDADLGPDMFCQDPGASHSTNRLDCDDSNGDINPDAVELCDDIDHDCDGELINGLATQTYYQDDDGDGYGQDDSTVEYCQLPDGYTELPGDCNDDPVTGASASPEGQEVGAVPDGNGYCEALLNCEDGIDNDCDGQTDAADWDCQDTLEVDPDGIPNGADAFYDVDSDSDGVVETLCLIAEYVFPAEYAQYGAVRQGTPITAADPDSSWLGYGVLDLSLTMTYEEVPGSNGALHAYCYDFTVESNDVNHIFRLVSERSALDSSQMVNELECTEWLPMNASCACRAFQSERYCRFGLSSRDLCDNVVGDVASVSWDTVTGLDRL